MAKHPKPERLLKSVHTALRIVDLIQGADGMSLKELTAELDIAKSSVHNYLATLQHLGYVVRRGNTYYVGLKFLDHGIYAKSRNVLSTVARPALEQLSTETKEAVWLVVEEQGDAVYLDGATGDRAVTTYGRVGKRAPIHSLASGKAILAHMDPSERENILSGELTEVTEHTITDRDELERELQKIRDRGYALNIHEVTNGVRAVGAPIIYGENVLGALSVSGPANRMKGERIHTTLPALLLGATNEIELKLRQ